ncbi:MAG: hypothetical protein U0Y82_02950 [Thermoleophilia bacterium]
MSEPPIELVGETDRLFALDPGEFVAARNDLVRRLKAAGATEAAERTRRLSASHEGRLGAEPPGAHGA